MRIVERQRPNHLAGDVHYFFNKFLTDCASSVEFLGDLRALTGHWRTLGR
jgi:hypothetical protein